MVSKDDVIDVLSQKTDPVRLDTIVDETDSTRREVKSKLRILLDEGMIKTTPGFKYALSDVRR